MPVNLGELLLNGDPTTPQQLQQASRVGEARGMELGRVLFNDGVIGLRWSWNDEGQAGDKNDRNRLGRDASMIEVSFCSPAPTESGARPWAR